MFLIKLWVIWASFSGVVFAALFLWAVRNRQFTCFDRQRYLPLDRDAAHGDKVKLSGSGIVNLAALVGMVGVWLGMIIYTLWISFSGGL